ncbi:MAG: heme-binding protein [Bryobacterales bacterium]|nr:heme-binding protein [Bryobacterales bacterium]
MRCGFALLLCLSVVMCANAQTATKKVITLEAARKIAAAAEAEALRNKWNVAIAIVDDGGNLVYLQRLDGTQIASIDICQFKARGAVGFKRPTKEFEDRMAKGAAQLAAVPWMAPVEGGLPLVIGGELVGAIGVSGVTSQQDGVVAAAGAALAAQMK